MGVRTKYEPAFQLFEQREFWKAGSNINFVSSPFRQTRKFGVCVFYRRTYCVGLSKPLWDIVILSLGRFWISTIYYEMSMPLHQGGTCKICKEVFLYNLVMKGNTKSARTERSLFYNEEINFSSTFDDFHPMLYRLWSKWKYRYAPSSWTHGRLLIQNCVIKRTKCYQKQSSFAFANMPNGADEWISLSGTSFI